VEPSPLLLRPCIGLLYQPWIIDGDDCGAVSGMNEWQGKPEFSETTAPVPIWPAEITHDSSWDRTRVAAVGIVLHTGYCQAPGIAVDGGNVLQPGRSRLQIPAKSLDCLIFTDLWGCVRICTRNLPGVKGGRRLRLKTSPPFVSLLSRKWESRCHTTLRANTSSRDTFTRYSYLPGNSRTDVRGLL
jgi:hypothetical protein